MWFVPWQTVREQKAVVGPDHPARCARFAEKES